MPLPTEDSLIHNARESYDKWNFQNCIGCIDGKHIRIKCPTKSGIMFYNYEHYFSLVLHAIADAKYKFVYIDSGSYGKRSDGETFMNSTLSSLGTKVLRLPEDDEFPNSDVVLPHLVGDDAYRLKSYNKENINNLYRTYCLFVIVLQLHSIIILQYDRDHFCMFHSTVINFRILNKSVVDRVLVKSIG